jgi:hypothetical protein
MYNKTMTEQTQPRQSIGKNLGSFVAGAAEGLFHSVMDISEDNVLLEKEPEPWCSQKSLKSAKTPNEKFNVIGYRLGYFSPALVVLGAASALMYYCSDKPVNF